MDREKTAVSETNTANENDANIANQVPLTKPLSSSQHGTDSDEQSYCKKQQVESLQIPQNNNRIDNEENKDVQNKDVPPAAHTSPMPVTKFRTTNDHTAKCSELSSQQASERKWGNTSLKAKMPSFGLRLNVDEDEGGFAISRTAFNDLEKSDSDGSDNDNDHERRLGLLPLTQMHGDESDSDSSSSDNSDSDLDGEENDFGNMEDGSDSDESDNNNDVTTLEQKGEEYLRRRRENMARHNRYAKGIGLLKSPLKEKEESGSPGSRQSSTEPSTPSPKKSQTQTVRGMIFATPYNTARSTPENACATFDKTANDEAAILRQLEESYPHRHSQIQQLWSLLSPALSTSDSPGAPRTKHVPPPIFVTGGPGSGKTCIVRDVVAQLQQTLPPNAQYRIGSAYINCATLEGSIDEIVHSAFRQLAQDMKTRGSPEHSQRKRKRKRAKRNKPSQPHLLGYIGKSAEDAASKKLRAAKEESNETVRVGAGREIKRPETHSNLVLNDKQSNCTRPISHPDGGLASTTGVHSEAADDNMDKKEIENVKGNRKRENEGDEEMKQNGGVDIAPRVRRSSRLKETEDYDNDPEDAEETCRPISSKLVKEVSLDVNATKTAAVKEGDLTASTTPASTTAQNTAGTFGRELQHTLFQHTNDSGFLILDQAERLLSLSSSPSGTSASKSNFLAQLLLLPRTYGLNLTIIVITKSILLEHSRFNNLVKPDKSLSTLSSAIQPFKVNFTAYKGKETIKEILMQPPLLAKIIGPGMLSSYSSVELDGDNTFLRQIVRSFLNTLVNTLYGSIRDLKEFVRLGRSLWPLYVQPLQSRDLRKTLQSVQKRIAPQMTASQPLQDMPTKTSGKHILSFLDQQILPQIRLELEHGLYSLTGDQQMQQQNNQSNSLQTSSASASNSGTSSPDVPRSKILEETAYLGKCLMLAAFICQQNKADKDKQLFTIQKNGKKNNSRKKTSHGEDLAYGSARNGAPKSFRPRLFPMERMLSVFISIVGLNEGQQPGEMSAQFRRGNQIRPSNIGSSDFFESLSHLRDVGVLHDKASTSNGASVMEEVNLSAPKYWCSLTRDEAELISKSISFPLENYLY